MDAMDDANGRRVREFRVPGGGDTSDQVARLLCPDPDHDPPCPVPWCLSAPVEGDGPGAVVGVYATAGQADDLLRRLRRFAPGAHEARAGEDLRADYPELLEQHAAEAHLLGEA